MDMETELKRMLMSLLRTRKRKLSKVAEDRLKRGLCMIPGCTGKAETRGVCRHHVNRYYSQLRACRTEQERRAFEATAIKEELILPSYEQPRMKRTDPYSMIAQESA